MNLVAPFSRLFASKAHGGSADQNGGFDLYVTKKSYSLEDAPNRNGVTRFKSLDVWALIFRARMQVNECTNINPATCLYSVDIPPPVDIVDA